MYDCNSHEASFFWFRTHNSASYFIISSVQKITPSVNLNTLMYEKVFSFFNSFIMVCAVLCMFYTIMSNTEITIF